MNLAQDYLPKAIRWSRVLSWIFLIKAFLLLLYFIAVATISIFQALLVLIPFSVILVCYWFSRQYKIACQKALSSLNEEDFEIAIRKQSALIKCFGVLSLIIIILFLLNLLLGLSALQYFYYLSQ